MGRDHTLWALTDGWCYFTNIVVGKHKRKVCNVVQFDPNVVDRMRYAQKVVAQQEREVLLAQRAALLPPPVAPILIPSE
jgi:hypothetical protein